MIKPNSKIVATIKNKPDYLIQQIARSFNAILSFICSE